MARKFVKAVSLVSDDGPGYTAEVFKTSPGRYVTEFRKGAGRVLHKEVAEHQSDAWAIRTAVARLQQMKRKGNPDQGDARYSVHIDMGESVHAGERKDNPEPGPAGGPIATQEEVNEYVRKMDEETLFASAAYGRKPSVKDWESGKDFKAHGHRWVGGPYFSIRDVDEIYRAGYRKIVVGGTEGFNVELVMQ